MKIDYKNYEIELKDDRFYSIQSTHNMNKYQFEYSGGQLIENRVFTINKRAVRIQHKESKIEISSAILCENGGRATITPDIFKIKNDKLLVMIGDKMYGLAIPTLEVKWFKELNYGTLHSLHPFGEDFIIHGNLGLIRINENGEVKWRFMGGRGVFIPGKERLKISEKYIELVDGNDKKFVINDMGEEIT